MIETKHVFQLLAEMPIQIWKKWWPVIEKLRLEWDNERNDNVYQNFHYLALRMMRDYDSVQKEVLGKISSEIAEMSKELELV